MAYLNAALEDGDPSLVSAALGDMARARGMTQLAHETGIARDGLYKALSPTGNPYFATAAQKVVRVGATRAASNIASTFSASTGLSRYLRTEYRSLASSMSPISRLSLLTPSYFSV